MRILLIIVFLMALSGSPSAAIGPFEIVSQDSSCVASIKFAGQLKLQYESKDLGLNKEPDERTFMEIRRVRPILDVKLPRKNLSFRLHLSTAPGSLELMDFYFDYRFQTSLRLGQFKIPFTRYRIQSFQRLTFVDWSIVTRYFGAERQMGILGQNYQSHEKWGLGYAVGLFTGVNARASHAVGLAAIYGEETSNPSDLAETGPRGEFHPEVVIHVYYTRGDIDLSSDTDARKTGLRYFIAFSMAQDLNPAPYQDLKTRVALEIMTKYRGFSINTIGYAGYEKEDEPDGIKPSILGGLLQGACRISNLCEISARYAIIDFDERLTDAAYQRAQQIINGAGEDVGEITAQYKNAGMIVREQEVTLGLNMYWDEHFLKWQNDLGWLGHSRRDGKRDDYVVRSQLQLAF